MTLRVGIVTATFGNSDHREQMPDSDPHLHCREASIVPSPCRRRGTASAVDEVSKDTNARQRQPLPKLIPTPRFPLPERGR